MLVLASRSPRRQDLLRAAGISFEVRPADVDERPLAREDPVEHAERLARLKAEAVQCRPGEVILGADTIVVVEGRILGKPEGREQAVWMLRQLSGRVHEVVTGVCLRTCKRQVVSSEVTRVYFSELTEDEIEWYVSTGEPLDKAGAYGIQGFASRFIYRIEGCYFNVVGLPVARVWRMLKEVGAGG